MGFDIHVTALTDRGLLRSRNEDAILVGPWISQSELGVATSVQLHVQAPTVAAVADGIGGHAGGNVASRQALTVVADVASQWYTELDVEEGLLQANEQLGRIGRAPQFRGLGTTIAGMRFSATSILAFNIGDSRIYQICEDSISQLSVDDAVLDDDGRPTNIITQSLGDLETPPTPHIVELPVAEARYLLCSDGISSVIPDEEFESACRCGGPHEIVKALMTSALGNGARDNFSVLIVDVIGVTPPNGNGR